MLEQTATSPVALTTRWSSVSRRDVVLNLAVALTYWAIAEITLLPALQPVPIIALWPAAGIAVAAVLLGGTRLLPGVVVGAMLPVAFRSPVLVTASAGVGMALQVLLDVWLLRRWQFDQRLERVRDPLLLAAVSAVGAIVSATVAVAIRIPTGVFPAEDAAWHWLLWWMRDSLGVQVMVALVATWASSRSVALTWRRGVEAGVLLVVLLLVSQLMFGFWAAFPSHRMPMAFVFFPIVGYAGLRFGPAGAATMTALVAFYSLPIIALGLGPFGQLPVLLSQGLLHAFLLLGSLSGQVLAAVMAEREEALQRRIALEEQLRHSQKMEAVGRLAGGIAHDFNNLLTAIIGYTEIVIVGLGPSDPRRADAEEIARAAMRAADLTRQMLAFSRKQVLQPKVIDLNITLSKVEPMLRRVIGEDIVMTIAPKAQRAQVRVDPGQIEQVIMNLVVNARDAMPRGGRLTVETGDAQLDHTQLPPDARPGAYVMLAVADTGIGMSADVRARIFEPYYTTKEIGKGTGLGLSTAYGIVRQSDGHILVNSEPGLGTTFRIYLPRSEAVAATAVASGEEDMPRGTEHILLVEDDPSVRRLTREILVRLGYSITEAASGRAGLALGSDDTRHFDLALCDVILGDMSGPAVFEALRALRPSVRVLYMSGYADEAIVKTGVLDEGQPFLQKPFTPRDLAIKVREVLDAEEEA